MKERDYQALIRHIHDPRAREIMRLLLHLAKFNLKHGHEWFCLTNQQIADYTVSSARSVERIKKNFLEAGLIKIERKHRSGVTHYCVQTLMQFYEKLSN